MNTPTHFHSSDDRFCGCADQMRAFTFDADAVTCSACKDNDTFELSDEAVAYVVALEK